MNAGPSKKSIRQQSVSVADLLDPDTSGCNDDEDEDDNEDNDEDEEEDDDDLVDFLPALEVLGADESVVVEESLGDHRVGRVDHRVVNRRQALPVSVVRAEHWENVKTLRGDEEKEMKKANKK